MQDDYKIELLQKIGEVFMKYGVRSVNMDDIAKHLSISKKTLYKYFKDKNEIVQTVMVGSCEVEKCVLNGFCSDANNAVEEMVMISQFVNEKLQNLNPSVMFDLQKYYPETYQTFFNHKNVFIMEGIKLNIERGIKEGLYRDNINPYIIAQVYISKMDVLWDTEIFPSSIYSFAEVHTEMIRYHLRGIVSEKGLVSLKEILKNDSKNKF